MINVDRMIVKLLFLFTIGTLLNDVPIVGEIVNKLLYAALLLFLAISMAYRPILRKDMFALMALAVMFVYDCIITGPVLYNFNELFYLATWVVYLIYARTNFGILKKCLYSEIRYIKKIVVVWELLIVLSLPLPFSWDGNVFYSFTGGQHRMDSASIMIFAAILIIYRLENYRKKVLLLTIIPSIAVILSGARTYLVILGVILAVFYYYSNIKRTYVFYITIIPIAVLAIYLILSTSVIQDRIAEMKDDSAYFTSMGYNALTAITSGRSTFWLIDLEKYWESPILNRILGNGFNFVRYVNETYYTTAIWAHNDFINIICCNGIVGLFLYFYVYFEMVKSAMPSNMERKVVVFMTRAFHVCCLFNAMFNMLYSYFAAALAVPVLLFAMLDDTILLDKMK